MGLLCIQDNVVDRPTMSYIIFMLNNFSYIISILSEPGGIESNNSKGTSIHASINEASITELYFR